MCDEGVLFAGEGYEYTVTVDDEDSKVIIFDNWKQVSGWQLRPLSVFFFTHLNKFYVPSSSLPSFSSHSL